MKVRLYHWDGKTLKEDGVLENNKGVVSALAFSPDGAWLAAGDVRVSSIDDVLVTEVSVTVYWKDRPL